MAICGPKVRDWFMSPDRPLYRVCRLRRAGYSLLEALVVLAMGSFFTLITVVALTSSIKVYNATSGRDTAIRELNKARRVLERDLNQASNTLSIVQSPPTHGGGADGDAINYLSAVNVTDGSIALLPDGSGNPYFFQNIFYYITTPTNHDALFGQTCTGGNDGGYDYNCPHKILIRGVEEQNPTYDPSDDSTIETLLSPLAPFLAQPTGFPNTTARDTVAINLLTFQLRQVGNEIRVDLRAVSIADARRKVSLGNFNFNNSGFALQYIFSVFPRN